MLTPNQIIAGMAEKNQMLTAKNEEYKALVEKRADALYNYRVAVGKRVLELRIDGHSVSLVETLVRGDPICADLKRDPICADLKRKYEIAKGVERANLESIKDLRSAIDTYRSLLAWQKAEMLSQ
jgi:hypothetical protein